MKIVKLTMMFVFLMSQVQLGFSIGKPDVIKPSGDTASLRPLIQWRPVKNAATYTYKVVHINSSTGAKVSTIESGTINAPTNSVRLANTLLDGSYYKVILRAVNSSGVKSDKEKLFFQAKEKCLYLFHGDFVSLANLNSGVDETYLRAFLGYFGSVVANGGTWASTASFKLPNGAIITGFEVEYNDDEAADASFALIRTNGTDILNQQDTIASVATSGINSDDQTTEANNVDSSVATIDNENYQYEMTLSIGNGNTFIKAKISYID